MILAADLILFGSGWPNEHRSEAKGDERAVRQVRHVVSPNIQNPNISRRPRGGRPTARFALSSLPPGTSRKGRQAPAGISSFEYEKVLVDRGHLH
jgi:hypothetical protein